jgi:hypothetical protein
VLKKSDPPEILKSFTLEKIDSYAPELAAYTDGSKSQSGLVSAAYCIPEINVSKGYRLSNNLSIYTAELQAIKLCLEFILSTVCKQACYDSRSVVIFTDSLSSAISLGARVTTCPGMAGTVPKSKQMSRVPGCPGLIYSGTMKCPISDVPYQMFHIFHICHSVPEWQI